MRENDSATEDDEFDDGEEPEAEMEVWMRRAIQPNEVPVRIGVALEFCKLCMISGMNEQSPGVESQATRNAALRLLTQYFYGEVNS